MNRDKLEDAFIKIRFEELMNASDETREEFIWDAVADIAARLDDDTLRSTLEEQDQ